jgi:hypothetical protein
LLEGVAEAAQLGLTADHRCRKASLDLVRHREQRVRRHRLRLSFQLESPLVADLDRRPHQTERLLADEHFAGLCGLLEPRRDVDRIAGRKALLGPGHDLPGVDPDPSGDAELGQRVAHLERRAAGAQGVVLVRGRHAEDGHDRVADELLHRATV